MSRHTPSRGRVGALKPTRSERAHKRASALGEAFRALAAIGEIIAFLQEQAEPQMEKSRELDDRVLAACQLLAAPFAAGNKRWFEALRAWAFNSSRESERFAYHMVWDLFLRSVAGQRRLDAGQWTQCAVVGEVWEPFGCRVRALGDLSELEDRLSMAIFGERGQVIVDAEATDLEDQEGFLQYEAARGPIERFLTRVGPEGPLEGEMRHRAVANGELADRHAQWAGEEAAVEDWILQRRENPEKEPCDAELMGEFARASRRRALSDGRWSPEDEQARVAVLRVFVKAPDDAPAGEAYPAAEAIQAALRLIGGEQTAEAAASGGEEEALASTLAEEAGLGDDFEEDDEGAWPKFLLGFDLPEKTDLPIRFWPFYVGSCSSTFLQLLHIDALASARQFVDLCAERLGVPPEAMGLSVQPIYTPDDLDSEDPERLADDFEGFEVRLGGWEESCPPSEGGQALSLSLGHFRDPATLMAKLSETFARAGVAGKRLRLYCAEMLDVDEPDLCRVQNGEWAEAIDAWAADEFNRLSEERREEEDTIFAVIEARGGAQGEEEASFGEDDGGSGRTGRRVLH
jgi:hypothetical protein